MALKIPEAPKRIGGTEVLREPSQLQPTVTGTNIKADTSGLQGAVKDLGTAYGLYQEQQNNAYFTSIQTDYYQFMSATSREIFDKNQRGKAQNLYVLLKEKSDKWLEDRTGAPKDDGVIRVSGTGWGNRLRDWVNNQQPSWIQRCASYEGQEHAKYVEEVYDANDIELANYIRGATTDSEAAHGMNEMIRASQIRYQGGDPRYIQAMAAKKIDDALYSKMSSVVATDPNLARHYLFGSTKKGEEGEGKWATLEQGLSSGSRGKLVSELQQSWVEKGTEALSIDEISGKSYTDAASLEQIFGTRNPNKIKSIQDNMLGKAKEKRDARETKAMGERTRLTNLYTNDYITAKGNGDIESMQLAIQNIASLNPEKAILLQNSVEQEFIDANIEKQMFMINPEDNLAQDLASVRKTAGEEYDTLTSLQGKSDIQAEGLEEITGGRMFNSTQTLGTREEYINNKIQERLFNSKGYANKGNQSLIGESIEDSEARMDRQQQDLETTNKYLELLQRREAELSLFNKAQQLIANGDTGYLPELNSIKTTAYLDEIFKSQINQEAYQGLLSSYPRLEEKMASVERKFNKYSYTEQNLLKANVVREINNWKQKNGELPNEQQLEGIIQKAQLSSIEKNAENIRKIKDKYDTAMTVSINKNLSAGKSSDLSFEKAVSKASNIFEDFLDELSAPERRVMENHRDYCVSNIMQGNAYVCSDLVKNIGNKYQ